METTNIDKIVAAQANLPLALRRSRESIEMDEHAQDLKRASFGRGKLNEEERTMAYGIVLEKIALGNLALEGVDTETESIRLAQGLELQGRFTEASDAHPHVEEKERLLAVEAAVNAPDDLFCDCAPRSATLDGKQIEVYPHYEVKKVYSRKHKGLVSLVGCADCSEMNATPTPPEQLQRILTAHHSASKAGKPTIHEHVVLTNAANRAEQRG